MILFSRFNNVLFLTLFFVANMTVYGREFFSLKKVEKNRKKMINQISRVGQEEIERLQNQFLREELRRTRIGRGRQTDQQMLEWLEAIFINTVMGSEGIGMGIIIRINRPYDL